MAKGHCSEKRERETRDAPRQGIDDQIGSGQHRTILQNERMSTTLSLFVPGASHTNPANIGQATLSTPILSESSQPCKTVPIVSIANRHPDGCQNFSFSLATTSMTATGWPKKCAPLCLVTLPRDVTYSAPSSSAFILRPTTKENGDPVVDLAPLGN